jgi:Tfp pilus assembly protein PilO
MKLNDNQKLALTIAAFVLLLAGLGALNYTKIKERSQLASEIERFKGQEKAATEKIKQIPELREKRSKLINIIDQYAEILPKEEHVQHDTFVNIIDGYRADTKIVIQKAEYVKPKDSEKGKVPVAQESFVRHRYKFKLLGTVPDFIDFVNKIENHTRFLKVDAINIKPVGAANETGDDLSDKSDEEELARATEPVKEIDLTVSTYTYFKGPEKKI